MVGRNTLDVAIEVRILEGEFFKENKIIIIKGVLMLPIILTEFCGTIAITDNQDNTCTHHPLK